MGCFVPLGRCGTAQSIRELSLQEPASLLLPADGRLS